MHVLVTGADGFVGRALVAHLAGRGLRVTAATRGGPTGDDGRVRRVAVGDIGRAARWDEALEGVDAVVHGAGRAHVSTRDAADAAAALEVNRDGAVSLYEAATRVGLGRVVILSSITVLGGRTRPGRPFCDDDPFAPETPYAVSKREAETALAARAVSGPPLAILRPPLIAGRGVKGNLRSLLRLARTPLPLPLGGLANRRTLLSLPNLTEAIEQVLRLPDARAAAGTYNLGDALPVSTSEIVAALRRGLGRAPHLLPVPAPLASALARTAGGAGRLFGDLEVASDLFRRRFGFADVVDTTETLRELARAES